MIIFGGTLQNAVNYYAHRNNTNAWDTNDSKPLAHFTALKGGRNGLLYFKSFTPSPGVVAHEACHATIFMFESNALESVDTKTEEFFAYYVEFLVDNICKLV